MKQSTIMLPLILYTLSFVQVALSSEEKSLNNLINDLNSLALSSTSQNEPKKLSAENTAYEKALNECLVEKLLVKSMKYLFIDKSLSCIFYYLRNMDVSLENFMIYMTKRDHLDLYKQLKFEEEKNSLEKIKELYLTIKLLDVDINEKIYNDTYILQKEQKKIYLYTDESKLKSFYAALLLSYNKVCKNI